MGEILRLKFSMVQNNAKVKDIVMEVTVYREGHGGEGGPPLQLQLIWHHNVFRKCLLYTCFSILWLPFQTTDISKSCKVN